MQCHLEFSFLDFSVPTFVSTAVIFLPLKIVDSFCYCTFRGVLIVERICSATIFVILKMGFLPDINVGAAA